jgi:hypothetical protein
MIARHRLFAATVLLLIAATPIHGQTEFDPVREHNLKLLGAQLEAKHMDAARDSLRTYLQRYPGDATMRYNLACLVALEGDVDAAKETLWRALEDGYRDLSHLSEDPDLAILHKEPELVQHLATLQADLIELMQSRAISLTEGMWSEPQPLTPDPSLPVRVSSGGGLRVKYDIDDLVFSLQPADDSARQVLITVAWPQNFAMFETPHWSEFSAEIREGAPVRLRSRDGQFLDDIAAIADRWQEPVSFVTRDNDSWQITIPWSSLAPNRPPVELLVGLNVTVRHTDQVPPGRSAWIRDVFAGSQARDRRTYVPVSLDPGEDPALGIAGRFDRYVVVGDTVSAELGIQGTSEGELEIDVVATSDGETWRATQTAYADPDLSFATVVADLSGLPHGWFDLAVTVRNGPGRPFSWQDRGYRLSPDWFVERNEQLHQLPANEQSIVQYPLFSVLRGQQQVTTRSDPSPIAAMADLTDEFLARWERTGTVLPSEASICDGAFLLNADALHPCSMVLPDAASRQDAEVVVVLTDAPAYGQAVATRLHERRTSDDERIYILVSAPAMSASPGFGPGVVMRAHDWLTKLFAPASVRVVAHGSAAESALRSANRNPAAWSALMLLVADDFEPWALSSPARVAQMMAMTLGEIPIILELPPAPTSRARAFTEALGRSLPGLELKTATDHVLTPDDLADRITTWR